MRVAGRAPRASAGTSARSSALPSATAALRRSNGRAAPAHRRARVAALELAAAQAQQRRAAIGAGASGVERRERGRRPAARAAVGGQTSWQRSHPHTHVPTSGRSSRGIASVRWVRSEMQRVASIV